jgi:hypothetical protein
MPKKTGELSCRGGGRHDLGRPDIAMHEKEKRFGSDYHPLRSGMVGLIKCYNTLVLYYRKKLFSRKRKNLEFRCIDRKEGYSYKSPRGQTPRYTTQPKKR